MTAQSFSALQRLPVPGTGVRWGAAQSLSAPLRLPVPDIGAREGAAQSPSQNLLSRGQGGDPLLGPVRSRSRR